MVKKGSVIQGHISQWDIKVQEQSMGFSLVFAYLEKLWCFPQGTSWISNRINKGGKIATWAILASETTGSRIIEWVVSIMKCFRVVFMAGIFKWCNQLCRSSWGWAQACSGQGLQSQFTAELHGLSYRKSVRSFSLPFKNVWIRSHGSHLFL